MALNTQNIYIAGYVATAKLNHYTMNYARVNYNGSRDDKTISTYNQFDSLLANMALSNYTQVLRFLGRSNSIDAISHIYSSDHTASTIMIDGNGCIALMDMRYNRMEQCYSIDTYNMDNLAIAKTVLLKYRSISVSDIRLVDDNTVSVTYEIEKKYKIHEYIVIRVRRNVDFDSNSIGIGIATSMVESILISMTSLYDNFTHYRDLWFTWFTCDIENRKLYIIRDTDAINNNNYMIFNAALTNPKSSLYKSVYKSLASFWDNREGDQVDIGDIISHITDLNDILLTSDDYYRDDRKITPWLTMRGSREARGGIAKIIPLLFNKTGERASVISTYRSIMRPTCIRMPIIHCIMQLLKESEGDHVMSNRLRSLRISKVTSLIGGSYE